MRSTNLFLKKEKLKAEHERNLVEIRARQLEEVCRKMAERETMTLMQSSATGIGGSEL